MSQTATKIKEAKYTIDRLNAGIQFMMAEENVTAEAMVIGLMVNAAALMVHNSFAKGEPQIVRNHSAKQVIQIFLKQFRQSEKEVAAVLGERLKG